MRRDAVRKAADRRAVISQVLEAWLEEILRHMPARLREIMGRDSPAENNGGPRYRPPGSYLAGSMTSSSEGIGG